MTRQTRAAGSTLNLNRDPVDVAIGGRIRAQRTARRVSLEELGRRLGVTYQQVQKYESGSNRIAAPTLHRVCVELGCDYADVLPPLTDNADAALPLDAQLVVRKIKALPQTPQRALVLACVHGVLDAASEVTL